MKNLIYLLVIITLPFAGVAQKAQKSEPKNEESVLYSDNGEYRLDHSLTITDTQLSVWKKAEPKIFNMFHSEIGEKMKKEMKKIDKKTGEPKFSKRYIVSFDVDDKEVSNVDYASTPDKKPDPELKNTVKNHGKQIFKELKKAAVQNKDTLNFSGKYYLSL